MKNKDRKQPLHRIGSTLDDFFQFTNDNKLPLNKNVPVTCLYGRLIDVIGMHFYLVEVVKRIKESDKSSVRYIILETWLAIDYVLRFLLNSLLEFDRFRTEKFEPYYELCPQSHKACLTLLEKLVKTQDGLPNIEKYRDYEAEALTHFYFEHADKPFNTEKKTLKEVFWEFFDSYVAENYPEGIPPLKERLFAPDITREAYCINREWVNTAKEFMEYKRKIEKINTARNRCAHTVYEDKIFKALGICGKDKKNKTKNFCLELIKNMFKSLKC